jgi:uncharacterized protein with PQ loop repeat
MKLTILDERVSDTMNYFLVIANIINLVYNIPQMVITYKTKSTRDFSSWFIFLRIIGNSIWVVYAIDIDSLQMTINNLVTVIASVFIAYYKCNELYYDYKKTSHTYSDDIELLEVGDASISSASISSASLE